MLHIGYDKLLARMLGTTRAELNDILDNADEYFDELSLFNPKKPDKPRDVISVRGKLRTFQAKFYRKVLLRKLSVSPHSHGGVKGRNIKTNAKPHLNSRYIYKIDLQDFFPSIKQPRIYRLFNSKFACSPPVAKLCTRLCTYEHHLALGLITSPILADQIMQSVDTRIGSMCDNAKLEYTRFVDDLTISGPFDFEESGIPDLINQILLESGLTPNPKKYVYGKIDNGISITGIRKNQEGKIDVEEEYALKVEEQLEASKSLELGNWPDLSCLYHTPAQIRGRIDHIKWINESRGKKLLNIYKKINWSRVDEEARKLKLVVSKKRLTKKNKNAFG